MKHADRFFVGWDAQASQVDRRFLLTAALGLSASMALVGAGMARRLPHPGPGGWNQSAVSVWEGVLAHEPYPFLIMDGPPAHSALLVGSGKIGVQLRLAEDIPPGARVRVQASPIRRGQQLMLAVEDDDGWITRIDATPSNTAVPVLGIAEPIELGHVLLNGEIVDAKCYFGAMNPGYGLTHKACAMLCALGGLPLAFCPAGQCGTGLEAMLFLNEQGKPHGRDILHFVAQKVTVQGALVRHQGFLQLRTALKAILPG